MDPLTFSLSTFHSVLYSNIEYKCLVLTQEPPKLNIVVGGAIPSGILLKLANVNAPSTYLKV